MMKVINKILIAIFLSAEVGCAVMGLAFLVLTLIALYTGDLVFNEAVLAIFILFLVPFVLVGSGISYILIRYPEDTPMTDGQFDYWVKEARKSGWQVPDNIPKTDREIEQK